MSSTIDGHITDRTNEGDPFEKRLSNSIFSESLLESARGISKVAEVGSLVKPSDLSKSKDLQSAGGEDTLFNSQKDTASCSQN